jgi:hypothetical protein
MWCQDHDLPQCEQDKGADRGLQEKVSQTGPHKHRQGCSRAGLELQVPWCPLHQRTIMVQTYQDCCEEGTTPFSHSKRLERFGMGPQILKVLQLHHRASWPVASPPGIASDRKALQMVVRTAQYITVAKLPAIQNLQLKSVVYIHLSQIHLKLQFFTIHDI